MPSYAIHLAIAKEVIRKNKNNILNEEDFLIGSITPDFNKHKNSFHEDMLKQILEKGIKNDYDKGIFFHIYSDKKFYLEEFIEEFYNTKNIKEIEPYKYNNFYPDYNKIVPILIKKYNINNYPKEIEKYMQGEEGELKYIKLEKLFNYIDKMSDIIIEDSIKKLKNGMEV